MSKISVTPEIVAKTILDIFKDYNIPENGRLTVANLEQAWRRTGLRDSDLADGIKNMIDQGLLEPVRVEGVIALKLTQSGSQFLESSPTVKSVWKSLKTQRVLKKTRTRVPDGNNAEQERRQGNS